MPSLNRKIQTHGDRVILLLVIALAMISVIILYSSTSLLAIKKETTPMDYAMKQLVYFVIGWVAMFICCFIPLRWWRKLAYVMLGASAILLLLACFTKDHRHLSLLGLSIQPSELAKISVVLFLGRVLEISKMATPKEYLLYIVLPLGIICALTLQGSVSATLIILAVSFFILISSGIKKKYIVYTVIAATLAGGAAVGTFVLTKGKVTFSSRIETAMNRVTRHFSDEQDLSEEELKKTEQTNHAIQAIQIGGLTGVGPGNGLKKYILPHPYDDYVFATIVEEYGLLGAIVIMLLYLTLFYRCIVIAQACNKTFSIVTVLGLGLLVVLQAFLHICVNTDIVPVTGQTLPLISNGGTSIVILSCAVGVIMSINRTIEMTVEKEKVTARQIEEQKRQEEENIRKELKKLS